MPYLKVNNLSKTFVTPGGREIRALHNLSFTLEKGQILSVVGSNGAGKTTLLNCLRRFFPSDEGTIEIDGQPLQTVDSCIASVFQDVGFGVVDSMTPMENLALVESTNMPFLWSFPLRRYSEKIHDFLKNANLLDRFLEFENTPVSEISGGQRQQVAIAMAMMRHPQVLLLDEFVANLDPVVRDDILVWVQDWIRANKVTTLMITHDHALAESWGDLVLELCDGERIRFSETNSSEEKVEA